MRFDSHLVMILFTENFNWFSGSQKACDTLKDVKSIKVYGCERKTTVGPFPLKLPTMRRPRLHCRRDDNQTDFNSTTTGTPDENVAQHDTVIITLSIGKIIFSVHIYIGWDVYTCLNRNIKCTFLFQWFLWHLSYYLDV